MCINFFFLFYKSTYYIFENFSENYYFLQKKKGEKPTWRLILIKSRKINESLKRPHMKDC